MSHNKHSHPKISRDYFCRLLIKALFIGTYILTKIYIVKDDALLNLKQPSRFMSYLSPLFWLSSCRPRTYPT